MKTRIITILAITAMNIGLVSANNLQDKNQDGPVTIKPDFSLESLAPMTPAEATFEESTDAIITLSDISSLAPVTPTEASFDENIPDEDIVTNIAAPETPKEASFGDE